MTQQKTSLTRTLRVGESFSLDNGRIVMTLRGQTGRRATLNCQIDEKIKVDIPPPAPATKK